MKSLRERTEIQQAYLDGKQVQTSKDGIKWHDCPNLFFDRWGSIFYRIKPKPMEFYLFIADAGGKWIVDDGYTATQPGIIKKFIEVIE